MSLGNEQGDEINHGDNLAARAGQSTAPENSFRQFGRQFGHDQTIMSEKQSGSSVVKAGIGFGSALAITISWAANKSLLWACVHGLLSWFYVVYYAARYHQ